MRAKAQPTIPRRTELPALLAVSFAALASAAAVDEPEADEDEELDEPSELPEDEEVGDGEPVPFVADDAPVEVELEPLLYGAEPEMPDAPPVAELEGRTVAVPEAFEGETGEVGAEPSSADESEPVELELVVVLTSVSPSTMDSYEPVRSL